MQFHSSRESPLPPQALIDEVVVRFDAYARARAARDSLLPASHRSPREEQRAFEALQTAITRLRNSTG